MIIVNSGMKGFRQAIIVSHVSFVHNAQIQTLEEAPSYHVHMSPFFHNLAVLYSKHLTHDMPYNTFMRLFLHLHYTVEPMHTLSQCWVIRSDTRPVLTLNLQSAEFFFMKTLKAEGFQFEVIITVLVSSFRFI